MGEGWASALTQHPTHTHRELGGKRGRKRFVSVRLCLPLAGKTYQEFSAGVRMSLFLIGGLEYMLPMVTYWRDPVCTSYFLSIMCLCKHTA